MTPSRMNGPFGTHQNHRKGPRDVSRDPRRKVHAEISTVGKREFHLRRLSHRTKDAYLFEDSSVSAYDCNSLIGGKLPRLHKLAQFVSSAPGPKSASRWSGRR